MSSDWLPLFPLEIVLLPGASMPLHIFEPRYRLMTRLCREQQREFGIILARGEGVARVGCTAEIVQLVKEYPDGRSDILTVGRRRFRLNAVSDELEYLQGEVEFLADEDAAPDSITKGKLLIAYAEVHRLVHGRDADATPEAGEGPLSYRLAAELPFELEFKQELLETDSEAERQRVLLERLEAWAAQLRQLQRSRRKASGNGHGR
ncbi:MAG TPA: LON peptidase substrate-binding domain-containing protein [Candidatus Acidoferrales bacterium]|nr:LON peptidase substrate-binding domain-containing protein [Candidatus Acidoferrales bacterium]